MPTFEEALRASLEGVDRGFRSAEADLRQQVNSASQVVAKLTGQRAYLELLKEDERPSGTFFTLRLVFNKRYYEVAAFQILAKGYPIRGGRSVSSLVEGAYETNLLDRPGLEEYFVNMASNPESPLVLRIALLLRNPETNGG